MMLFISFIFLYVNYSFKPKSSDEFTNSIDMSEMSKGKEKNKIIDDFVKLKNELVKSMKLTPEETKEYGYERLVTTAIVATKNIFKI